MLIRDSMTRRLPAAWAIVLLLLGVITLGLPSEVSVAEPKTEKQALDFSPGEADQLFAVPKEMWSNINHFAFLICFDENVPNATRLELNTRVRELSGFSDLYSACRVWGEITFPALQSLATELSKGDIKELLSQLQASLKSMRSNPGGAQGEFKEVSGKLNHRLVTLSELSGQVNQQLMAFYKISDAVIGEYKRRNFPDSPWVNIGPKLDDVRLAMGSMVGRWNMLTSNLAYLRKTLELPAGPAGIPELYDLDIEVGLSAWDEVVERAKAFHANAPAQLKYLSGENYYDECPLNEGSWYVMKNLFLNDKGYVLTAQRPGQNKSDPHTALLVMKPQSPAELEFRVSYDYDKAWSQQWQFHRLGKGWWSIESRIRNDTGYPFLFLLDASAHVPRTQLISPHMKIPYTLWWRCLATTSQGPGWFRLVNATLGELQGLDTYSDYLIGFMGNTKENFSGQYWRFELVGSP